MPAGCIRERNGRFYVRTRALVIDPRDGSSRWRHIEKAAGTSRRKAERMLRSIQDDLDDGRYVPSSLTVLQLGNRWLSEHVQPNLKPATAANYRETLYQHIAPALGHTRLDDLHSQMIRSLLGRKRAEGLSEETVAKIRRHLHAMLAFAQDAGLLSVNPAENARARGGHKVRRRARGTQLTPVQVKRFLQECSPRWRAFFTVAIDTGLRRGELIGLRWEDIDLLQRILHVRRSISAYDTPDAVRQDSLTTKTEAGQRLVPILDGAQATLEELYTRAQDKSEGAPVFATIERKRGRDGILRPAGRPLNPRMVTRVFRRYAERAGLPCTIRLHDLRHTAITNAISQGEDILLIAAFAGHAKTSTTVDVYAHLMPDRVRQAAQRMRSISGPDIAGPAPPSQTPTVLVRELESSSAYTTGPLGDAATTTARQEHASAPLAERSEQARTDTGASMAEIARALSDHRTRAQLLAGWEARTRQAPPGDAPSTARSAASSGQPVARIKKPRTGDSKRR